MTEQNKRERVINGLEHCIVDDEGYPRCKGCAYGPCNNRCFSDLATDALALLKAQEPQEVIRSHDHVEGIILRCPRCKNEIHKYNGKYCPNCGQAVKWE